MSFNRPKTYQWVRDRINNFNDQQITKQLKKYAGIANRRIDTLEKHYDDAYSPALHAQYKRTNSDSAKIDANPGGINQKRSELIRALDFLEDDTSTLKGSKQYKKDTQKALGLENKRVSSTLLSNVWTVINMARENVPIIANYKDIGDAVYDLVKDYDFKFSDSDELSEEQEEKINEIALKVTDIMQDTYEELESKFNKNMSGGFSIHLK